MLVTYSPNAHVAVLLHGVVVNLFYSVAPLLHGRSFLSRVCISPSQGYGTSCYPIDACYKHQNHTISTPACFAETVACFFQGLQQYADAYIGDELTGKNGISNGQKHGVSVGLELVSNPWCIFLGEPTSGLDTEIAE